MARLPTIDADEGIWGALLNSFLLTVHNADGTIRDGIVSEANLATAVVTKLNSSGGNGVASVNTRTGAVTITKTDVGLSNVDNTADTAKPLSTATLSALGNKAPLVHSHTISQLSDLTATGAALASAADAAAARTAIGAGTSNLALGSTGSTAMAGNYTPTKSDVGLGNADNTSDLSKPISTAVQTALNAKADTSALGTKVLLINDAGSLPAGTPAGVIVVVKA